MLDLEKADDFGSENHSRDNSFSGNSGSVTWQDVTFGVTGCAGYAQARSYIKVAGRQHEHQQHGHPVGPAVLHRLIRRS